MKSLKNIDYLKWGEVVMIFALSLVPFLVRAELPQPSCGSFTGLRCTGERGVNDLIITVVNIIIGVAFVIAVLFLVIGGFRYITSQGNEEQAEKGRNTIVNALIGIVVVILSYIIVRIVSNTVSTGGTGSTTP